MLHERPLCGTSAFAFIIEKVMIQNSKIYEPVLTQPDIFMSLL